MDYTTFSPLKSWLDRTLPIPDRFYNPGHIDTPRNDWGAWLGLEERHDLHETLEMEWLGLTQSRSKTEKYLQEAGALINGLEGGWLDSEESAWIREKLGEPPRPCLPIYIMTTGDGDDESLQYIGKTASQTRFLNGHPAITKLMHPQYQHLKKSIYRCSVWFHFGDEENDDGEYIALEWLQPEALALTILDDFESQLIYQLQPPLNTLKKKAPLAKTTFDTIHIQNITNRKFLNDRFLYT